MGQIIGSEVGRRFSPGFASISIQPARRRRFPRWAALVGVAGVALSGLLLFLGR
ncbi:hypothetical protein [Caulobacter sp. S45]|jgi:hypothetical protein|uniref:hypothetical protein n=1 Tax=Caulobacter sp. S45 TaxID=1641861 RepID=UPI00131B5F78|nr:hypothetical protein [Caulobacter sp. S45]